MYAYNVVEFAENADRGEMLMSSDSIADEFSTFETLTLRELFPYWGNLVMLNSMRPMLRSMLQLDLTISENAVLRQLKFQSLTIAQAAEYLSLTHSAASRAIDRLVHDGLVCRVENP